MSTEFVTFGSRGAEALRLMVCAFVGVSVFHAEIRAAEPESRPAATTQPSEPSTDAEKPSRDDFFEAIKQIDLGGDLKLRLGGEMRGRLEAVTHKRYGDEDPTQDTFFLHRYLYRADFQYGELGRFFIEGVSAWIEDRDGTAVPNAEDRFDVHQMFLDLRVLGEHVPMAVRFGRQELSYGRERLVSPLGWANVQRTWDGVKVLWADEGWSVDAWYVRPVEIVNRDVDNYSSDVQFYGLYSTCAKIEHLGIDMYFLGLRNSGEYTNANITPGNTGDLSLYTLGTRLWGAKTLGDGAWDYDTELAGQWGKAAGDTVCAMMWSTETGYSFSDCPMSPRIGVGVDYASGDSDPFDNRHETFNQLYPLGHAYFGYLDQVGRQNVWAQNVNLTMKPHKAATSRLAWHTFWTDKNVDALYNAGGGAVRRSPTGGVGDEIGHELDYTLLLQLNPRASVLFGYSHMWATDFIAGTGSSEDPDLFYLQYRYQF